MTKMKKILSFFILLFSFASLNAADGVMWGEKGIRVVKTVWFDIIYPPDSEQSAALLVQNADSIYVEVAALYGRKPQVRFPVVLSPKTEQYNAYYSSAPYCRIVLYDTAVAPSLTVFSNDLLSTFRHELTHALTFNLKNGFWSFMGELFGECISPASVTSLGWAEGAAVTSESANGEGRLNDEYSLHVVKQAKLENKFPSYQDEKGATDTYPAGSFYMFNGAFNQWLQDKYGMDKYAEFWYRCDNFYTFAVEGIFRRIYGISLKKAWTQFRDSFEVPDIPGNPLFSSIVTDFYSPFGEYYSAKNLSGALYNSLCISERGYAWIESKSSSVWLNNNKIFTLRGVEKISMSQDGRFMAVSYTDVLDTTYTKKVKIYDLDEKSWVSLKDSGSSDAAVFCSDGQYFVALMGFESQKKWIEIKKLVLRADGIIKGIETVKTVSVPEDTMPLYFTGIKSNKFSYAFVKKAGMKYSICLASEAEGKIKEYSLPYDRMVVRGLSCSDGKTLLFSWTKPGSMPRLGKLNTVTSEMTLYEDDLSGGIFNPVNNGDSIVYEGHFYRQNRLLVLDESAMRTEYKSPVDTEEVFFVVPKDSRTYEKFLEKSKKYSGFNGYKGVLLPVSVAESVELNALKEDDSFGSTNFCFLGATYLSSNPWGSNNLIIAAGYSPFAERTTANLKVTGGTDTSFFAWNIGAQTEFQKLNFAQVFGNLDFTFRFPAGKTAYIGLSNQLLGALVNTKVETVSARPDFSLIDDKASLWYSNVHKTGPGYFENAGFSMGVNAEGTCFIMNISGASLNPQLGISDLSPFINIYLPKLVPLACRNMLTYNMPVVLSGSCQVIGDMELEGNADVCLFGADIQKGLPVFTCLFVNRIYLNAGYNVVFAEKGNIPYSDKVYVKGTLGFTPNLSSILYTEVFGSMELFIRDPKEGKMDYQFSFGIQTAL